MEEREASLTGKFHELLGTSDGTLYESLVREPRARLNNAQTRMNEYLKALRPVPDDVYNEFADARIAFNEATKDAFQKELEVATGNMVYPQNTEFSALDGQNIPRPTWLR